MTLPPPKRAQNCISLSSRSSASGDRPVPCKTGRGETKKVVEISRALPRRLALCYKHFTRGTVEMCVPAASLPSPSPTTGCLASSAVGQSRMSREIRQHWRSLPGVECHWPWLRKAGIPGSTENWSWIMRTMLLTDGKLVLMVCVCTVRLGWGALTWISPSPADMVATGYTEGWKCGLMQIRECWEHTATEFQNLSTTKKNLKYLINNFLSSWSHVEMIIFLALG